MLYSPEINYWMIIIKIYLKNSFEEWTASTKNVSVYTQLLLVITD